MWLASILQYLERFISTYGDDHILVKVLYEKSYHPHFRIPLIQIIEWGKCVDDDWRMRNAVQFSVLITLTNQIQNYSIHYAQ